MRNELIPETFNRHRGDGIEVQQNAVGRELGFDDVICYWPSEPQTFGRMPEQEAVMERVATDVLPGLRAAS